MSKKRYAVLGEYKVGQEFWLWRISQEGRYTDQAGRTHACHNLIEMVKVTVRKVFDVPVHYTDQIKKRGGCEAVDGNSRQFLCNAKGYDGTSIFSNGDWARVDALFEDWERAGSFHFEPVMHEGKLVVVPPVS